MEEVGEDGREPPSDEMWWGTPDPAIYKEGTLHLERWAAARGWRA
jgi:hypothetical protein